MRFLLILLFSLLILFICNSCLFTSSNDDHSTQEHYLKGAIRDADGNDITGATVYLVYDVGQNWKAVRDSVIPFELLSFTAALTEENYVRLTWETESESNLMGFYILRSEDNNMSNAAVVNSSIISATNTSTHMTYNYTDDTILQDTYYYWLQVIDLVGSSHFYGPILITTGPDDPPVIPVEWSVEAYPNPFESMLSIRFTLADTCNLKIEITDALNVHIRYLYEDFRNPGIYTVVWDAKDDAGLAVGNGLYKANLTARDANDLLLYHGSINLLNNDLYHNNPPAATSTASGYKLPLSRYLGFDSEFIQTDYQNNQVGVFTLDGNFTIYIYKSGYQPVSLHVGELSEHRDQTANFIMYPLPKR